MFVVLVMVEMMVISSAFVVRIDAAFSSETFSMVMIGKESLWVIVIIFLILFKLMILVLFLELVLKYVLYFM